MWLEYIAEAYDPGEMTYRYEKDVMYLNPRYVVIAWPHAYKIETVDMGGDPRGIRLTKESFDRLIAWMEAHE